MTGAAIAQSRGRLLLFAGGDFAFNLYWQSVMLYLLFYYTEALGLSLKTASACYAVASVWDGIASFGVGVLTARYCRADRYRQMMAVGALPLGLAFIFAYLPPPVEGTAAIVWIVVGHMAFRTAYAVVNVPYLAMSARISAEPGVRTLVAGGRMLAGTLGAVVVAFGTLPLGARIAGSAGPHAYAGAAMLFALIGTAILILVARDYRDDRLIAAPPPLAYGGHLALWRHRGFVQLSLAMIAMIVAVTMLDKSVLYYFKYRLGDQRAGETALGLMMLVSGLVIPLWLVIARRISLNAVWHIAVGVAAIALTAFIIAPPVTAGRAQTLLVIMQMAIVGLNLAVWALLPEAATAVREGGITGGEALVYGYTALFQRLAIGAGTLLLGFQLDSAHIEGVLGTSPALRLTIAVAPMTLLIVSALILAVPTRSRRSNRRKDGITPNT